MTQAFNLALLANNVNSSGQLNADTGLYNAVNVANGGTNLSGTPTNGQLLIGNGTGYTLATLTAGTNMSITNGSGSITLNQSIANGSITAPMLSGAQTGSAPIYGCRAWVNFNGTGTVAIRASGNVSSITDNGAGDYTVNFATAMPDANYCVVGTVNNQNTNGICVGVSSTAPGGTLNTMTASAVRVIANNVSSLYDMTLFSVCIFR